jgi:AraC-like DNA-binding protein
MFMLADWEETPIPKVMEEHFFYNLSIDEFASLCGKSLSSFKRDFQKLYKTSPRRWLTSKRLEYAKQLLLRSNDNIQEICYDIGFENDSHFNRIFKETYGLTPLQFRKNKAFA